MNSRTLHSIVVIAILLCDINNSCGEKINSEILNNYSQFFNFGDKKVSKLNKIDLENAIIKSKVDVLGEVFKKNIDALKSKGEMDLIFLVDASSSVGSSNFQSELKFVKKLMSDVTVDYNHTRVAIITFSSAEDVITNVDEISKPNTENNKCLLLNKQLNEINYTGGDTFTLGAFERAKEIFGNSRNTSRKVLFLITDGYSNGGDPIPLADELEKQQVTIFTIGIQNGNYKELYELSTSPGELYSYLLDSFQEFESLARRALHVDLQSGEYIPLSTSVPCDKLCKEGNCCDKNAICTCGTSTGHYSCLCQPGYYGTGLNNSCSPCPSGSFASGPNLCLPCPDVHHYTKPPAVGLNSCHCRDGFRATEDFRCEVLKCPKLSAPKHGYFVKKKECGNVLYTACGVRCEVGYTLVGSSIRLCQANGTWSGDSPSCQVKTCDALQPPPFGSVSCSHVDLGITYNEKETELPVDTICTFTCDKGRTLIGSKQRTCLPLARWDGLRTLCKQIKCNKLPQIQNGKIEPPTCTTEKHLYSKNCTYTCAEGYELVGPKVVSCTGQHGSWQPAPEQLVCTDKTPPTIVCPENIKATTLPGKNYGTVYWKEPLVADNSGLNVSVWTKPAIKNITEFKFQIGQTYITYFAQDAFKNRAKCKFVVQIEDLEPPTIEECESPPAYLSADKAGANVSWDEPNIFDNSQKVEIHQSHHFGFFPIGSTSVNYTAIDPSKNVHTCIMNITIEDSHCEALPDPIYGHSDCNSDKDGLQCIITCQEGYAVPLATPTDVISVNGNSSTSFMCSHADPVWYNEEGLMFPECSVTTIPTEVEQNGTIKLQPNEVEEVCNDASKINEVDNDIKVSLQDVFRSTCLDTPCNLNTYTYCENDEAEERTNIIKRHIQSEPNENRGKRKIKKRKYVNVKFNLKAELGGKTVDSSKIQDNLQDRLKTSKFADVANASFVLETAKFTCPVGYVLKKTKCAQCPKGTYHSFNTNKCQSCPIGYYNENVGQTACKTCPTHFSTRKLHSKSPKDCIEECPPGTRARKKILKHRKNSNITLHRITLKPHCRSCPLGTYQPGFGQTSCVKCPQGYNTTRIGCTDINDCILMPKDPCTDRVNVCNNGHCVSNNSYYYSCDCFNNYVGTHCEIKLNGCRSNPCLNDGICTPDYESNTVDFTCSCKFGYAGKYCESVIDRCNLNCQNGGKCFESDDDQFLCLCPQGYAGELCERVVRHCEQSICENNAKCLEQYDGYSCSCKDGYIGKRCSILPCDYQPCFGNSVCVNLPHSNATRESYRCECLEGYKGPNCTEKIDYCENQPCMNGGSCISGETNHSCVCSKLYTGINCEIQRNVSYTMKFAKYDINSYVKLNGFQQNLTEITVCLWMQTFDNFNYGTLISYANYEYDNAFTLTDYSGLVLYINNKHIVTDIYLNDGYWHHVCAAWQSMDGSYFLYIDGVLKQNDTGLSPMTHITGRGNVVIGQDQDAVGGKFSESESFLGEMAYVDIWSRILEPQEVITNMESCSNESNFGDLYGWPEMQENVHGDVKVEQSRFCGMCDMPRPLYNGFINVVDNLAYYQCNTGFYISSTIYSGGRKCTKASRWEGKYEPYCKKIYCGYPGFIRNGYITGRSHFYQDKITYKCNDGYTLNGNSVRVCKEDGKWFPDKPECQGLQCTAFRKPDNSDINILADSSYEDFIENVSHFDIGTQIEIICDTNANLTGENIITCQENGTWDFEPPLCETSTRSKTSSCSVEQIPHAPANGYVDLKSIDAVGNGTSNTIEYKCRVGFKLRGDNTSVCILDGYWSEPNITCDPILCSDPPEIKNMVIKHINSTDNVYHFGNIVPYECEVGYRMFGSNVLRCLANGRWTRMQGKCIKKSCRKPVVSEGTIIEGNSYLFEDTVTLICPNKGKYDLICDKDAQWIGERDSSC